MITREIEPNPIIGEEEIEEGSSTASYPEDIYFESKRHFPCFPTNLFEFQTENSGELNKILLDSLKEFPNPDNLPNWSSPPGLQNLKNFGALNDRVLEAAKQVLGFGSVQFAKVRITSLMSTTVRKPEKHVPEMRSNNVISGIYCAKAGKGKIVFTDPRSQAWVIRPPVSQANLYNSDAFVMELIEGKMIVFPAWLQLYLAFPEDMEENVYFSWNVMIYGDPSKMEED